MTDPSTSPDPSAPTRALSHDVVLWGGFGLCLLIAVLTVVLPELSGADSANKKPVAPVSAHADEGALRPHAAPAVPAH